LITHAYIQEYGQNKIEPEHKGVASVLERKNIPFEFFTYKKLGRKQLKINPTSLVVGDHTVMATTFKILGITINNNCYPLSLQKYYGRAITATTIAKLVAQAQQQEVGNVFIKPKQNAKLFTGFVANSSSDILALEQYAGNTQLYCATVVEWVAEYRVFVLRGNVLGIAQYNGLPNMQLDVAVVKEVVTAFENSDERTIAYALDFGVLASGATTLVEWNDAYALGAYNLNIDLYTEMLLARWEEMIK
jgi:hypothetical protein